MVRTLVFAASSFKAVAIPYSSRVAFGLLQRNSLKCILKVAIPYSSRVAFGR